jgi:hypothetical protein
MHTHWCGERFPTIGAALAHLLKPCKPREDLVIAWAAQRSARKKESK